MADSAACVHVWKFRSDIPVLDCGRLGIRTYECADCGLIADSDPETGDIHVGERELPKGRAGASNVRTAPANAAKRQESYEERYERWVEWTQLPYHFVPLSLYDEYQKLSEYAVGEMLTEIAQLRERVRTLGGSFK